MPFSAILQNGGLHIASHYRHILCALHCSNVKGNVGNDSDREEHSIYRFISVTRSLSGAVSPSRFKDGWLLDVYLDAIPPMELYDQDYKTPRISSAVYTYHCINSHGSCLQLPKDLSHAQTTLYIAHTGHYVLASRSCTWA